MIRMYILIVYTEKVEIFKYLQVKQYMQTSSIVSIYFWANSEMNLETFWPAKKQITWNQPLLSSSHLNFESLHSNVWITHASLLLHVACKSSDQQGLRPCCETLSVWSIHCICYKNFSITKFWILVADYSF